MSPKSSSSAPAGAKTGSPNAPGNTAVALAAGTSATSPARQPRSAERSRSGGEIPRSDLAATFGFPQLGNWLSFLALVLTAQGDVDGARAAIAESRSELERFPDPMSAMWADAFSSWRAIMDDDPEAARRRCTRFMALAETTATGVVQPQAEVVDGWARARLGDGEAGVRLIRAGRVGLPKALGLRRRGARSRGPHRARPYAARRST